MDGKYQLVTNYGSTYSLEKVDKEFNFQFVDADFIKDKDTPQANILRKELSERYLALCYSKHEFEAVMHLLTAMRS